jgi:integrase
MKRAGPASLDGEKPRTRYIEDWEVVEMPALVPRRKAGSVPSAQAYMRLKLLTGMRRCDLLRLTEPDLQADGIHVEPGKTVDSTAKRLIYEWSDEVRATVAMAKAARSNKGSSFLFYNRYGAGYFNEDTGRARGRGNAVAQFRKAGHD